MAYADMRQWLDRLEAEGQLMRITTEVDWNRELGAIVRTVFAQRGPALLFENIKGYKDKRCTKLFTGGLATPERLAWMLGLSSSIVPGEMVKVIRERLRSPLKPRLVAHGPVKENILKADELDLYDFPVPRWHHRDGGRYINTLGGVVTRDPDTGVLNVGIYRGMLSGKNKIPSLLVGYRHWGRHYTKYRNQGEAMPVAVAYGWDPVFNFVGGMEVPPTVSEYDVMGGLRGEPVALVKCETCDLLVPASAEIVVEGFVSPDPATWELEGPFGEYTGYFGGEAGKRPVIEVTCIALRNDPIFTGTLEGWGPGRPNENSIMRQFWSPALAWNLLEDLGVPDVLDIRVLPASCAATAVVKIRKTYRGQAKQVALALWGANLTFCKNVMVVDEDIDIYDPESLEWAFAYRVNPGENDLVVMPGCVGSTLDPATRLEERDPARFGAGKANRLLIDATKNWEYGRRPEWDNDFYPPVSFDLAPEDQELIKRRWKEYGF